MNRVKVKVNGYDIEYIDEGVQSGQVIVFAHGLGGNCDQWVDQIKYFSANYRVIAFTLQGHGDSEKPLSYDCYTIEKYADTVVELLKKLKASSCIWVGNSMGGVIGYEVMKRNQDLINIMFTNGTTPVLEINKFAISVIKAIDKALIKLMGLDGYIKFVVKYTSKEESAKEAILKIMIKASKEAVIASRVALGNYNYLDIVKNSKNRIFIIRCPYDKDINMYLKKYNDVIDSNSTVSVLQLADSGHIANLEKPEEYSALIDEVLNNIKEKRNAV